MPTNLSEMEYDEVSLVDRGANQVAHVTLFKRDDSEDNPAPKVVKRRVRKTVTEEVEDIDVDENDLDALGDEVAEVLNSLPDNVQKDLTPQDVHSDTPLSNVSVGNANLSEAVYGKPCGHRMGANKCARCTIKKSALHGVIDAVGKKDTEALWNAVLEFQNELEGVEKSWSDNDTPGNSGEITDFFVLADTLPINKADQKGAHMAFDKESLAPDVLEHVEGLETEIAALKAANTDVAKSDDGTEDIFKGLDPRVREVIEKAQKDADDAKQELAKREDERLTKEYIEKAASFKNLPINASEFGPVLKSLAAADPTALAEVERVLRAADAGSKTGEVFKQHGSDQSGTADVKTQVDTLAQEIVKSDSTLTIEQARAQVYRNNPALYEQTLGGEK